jgi:hypothetical protein
MQARQRFSRWDGPCISIPCCRSSWEYGSKLAIMRMRALCTRDPVGHSCDIGSRPHRPVAR